MAFRAPRIRPRRGILPGLLLLAAICVLAEAQEPNRAAPELKGTPSQFAGMVDVPAGTFEMGVDEKWLEKAFNMKSPKKCHPLLKGTNKDTWWPVLQVETPEHEAQTEAYSIDRYEVTNAQYKVFLDETSQKSTFTSNKVETLRAVAEQVFGRDPADWTVATIYYLNEEKLRGIEKEVLKANENYVQALLGQLGAPSWDALPKEKKVEAWAYLKLPVGTALMLCTRHVPRTWKEAKLADDQLDLPVGDVSGEDADAFAEWAGKHVPTEEEWEKAARGPEGYVYPWGNEWNPSDKKQKNWIYWMNTTTPPAPPYKDRPMAVTALPVGQSGYGCFHMLGNLMEWTSSFPQKYKRSDASNSNFGNERARVLRGLAWGDGKPFKDMELMFRCTARVLDGPGGHAIRPTFRFSAIGFRCAKYATPARDVMAHELARLDAKGVYQQSGDLDPARAYGIERLDYAPEGEEGKGLVFVRNLTKTVGFVPVERLEFSTAKALLEASGPKRKPEDPPVILGYLQWNGDLKVELLEVVTVTAEAPTPGDGVEEATPGGGVEEPEGDGEKEPGGDGQEEGTPPKDDTPPTPPMPPTEDEPPPMPPKEEEPPPMPPKEEEPPPMPPKEGEKPPKKGEKPPKKGEKPPKKDEPPPMPPKEEPPMPPKEGGKPAEGGQEPGKPGTETQPPATRVEEHLRFIPYQPDGLLVGIHNGRIALFAMRIKGPEVFAYVPDRREDPTLPVVVRGTSKPPKNGKADGPSLLRPAATTDAAGGVVTIRIAIPTKSKTLPDVFGVTLTLHVKGKLDGEWRETKPE